jgi:hypothetical protein
MFRLLLCSCDANHPAQGRDTDNSGLKRNGLSLVGRTRDTLAESLMRTRVVEVGYVFHHQLQQVPFTQDQAMIRAFSPQAPQEALDNRVGLRRRNRGPQDAAPHALCNTVKLNTLLGVIIADEILRTSAEWRCLP